MGQRRGLSCTLLETERMNHLSTCCTLPILKGIDPLQLISVGHMIDNYRFLYIGPVSRNFLFKVTISNCKLGTSYGCRS